MTPNATKSLSSKRKMEATTFHPFSRLPTELRIQIREPLIPELRERLVWVRKPGWIKYRKNLTSVLLPVNRENRESREVYLTRFPMGLQVPLREIVWPPYSWQCRYRWEERGVVYINPDHDILVIGQPSKERRIRDAMRDQLWTGKLLTQTLRLEENRNRIQNLLECPNITNSATKKWTFDESPSIASSRIV